jgi:diguanylate cyclase (GGDEF)-like protein/PAS domain S-box-containing protein
MLDPGRNPLGRKRRQAARRDAERRLHEAHASFESAFTNAPIGMALVDLSGRWLDVNDALCRITGYRIDQLQQTDLAGITHADDLDVDADELTRLYDGEIQSYRTEKRYRHVSGEYIWVLLTVSLVRNDADEPLYLISQIQDISERKEMATQLAHLIDHDFLTGLFNRRRFEQELQLHVERMDRYGEAGAVLLIDLDHFKEVNDTLGHKAGDDLLKGIASLLRQRSRRTDVLARLGGDEFGLLLPHADLEQARQLADELVKALRGHAATLGSEEIQTAASIGVAPLAGLSGTEALAYADLAMYEAKEGGRNRLAVYQAGDGRRPSASGRLAEADRIRAALAEDRFVLHGQPILDLAEEKICHYELLLRLQDDSRKEPLAPGSFLYAAERFGLILEIDSWVVRQAIALLAECATLGERPQLHVNLSGKSITDEVLAEQIEQALAKADVDPAALVFEVTETAAIANIEEARAFALGLRRLGCQLALDDFGSGFGSFFYLKNLPFDYLKIDGDYVRGLATSRTDQLLVQALVGIAAGMGKKTIAEFVPDETVTRLLREMGVDYAQGYHVGEPTPVRGLLGLAA